MRAVAGILLAGVGAFLWSDAEASTLRDFWYVGNPWVINSEPGPGRSLMTVGRLRIDTTAIPGGTLANHRTRSAIDWDSPVFWDVVRTPDFRSMTIDRTRSTLDDHRLAVDVHFDAQGRPAEWSMMIEGDDAFCYERCYMGAGNAASGEGYDAYLGMFYEETFLWVPTERDRYLRDHGYTPDMPLYQSYFNDDDIWHYERLSEGAGAWFEDLDDAARAIERNSALALANPARGLPDIAPVPLPAPIFMLLASLGVLALARRRDR